MTVNLFEFDLPGLERHFQTLGERPFRARQVFRWLHGAGVADFAAMSDLAKSLRQKLAQEAEARPLSVRHTHLSTDGTRKWLFGLESEQAVETVFIPETGRGTLCISTQVGCSLNCAFCSTGRQGFNRNLSTAEIIGQLWLASHTLRQEAEGERVVSNVVVMGMGEPLMNLDALLPALHIMLDDHGYGLSRRRVTVSTAGVVPQMDRLAAECPVALAVSLHAPDDALRDELVPLNRKYPLRELLAACRRYVEHSPRDFITFEYILIDGVNDSPAHARALLALLADMPAKVNLIPFNPFPAVSWKRSSPEAVRRFQETLIEGGMVATARKTRGDDIAAACGQLAGQVEDRSRRTARLAEERA